MKRGRREGRGSLGRGKKRGKGNGGDKSPAWPSQDLGSTDSLVWWRGMICTVCGRVMYIRL